MFSSVSSARLEEYKQKALDYQLLYEIHKPVPSTLVVMSLLHKGADPHIEGIEELLQTRGYPAQLREFYAMRDKI